MDAGNRTKGQVIRIDRKGCHVQGPERVVLCSLRGRLFEGKEREGRPVAVGDQVQITVQGENGVIEEVLPRRTQVVRPQPRARHRNQVLAANVDVLLIVASLRQPANPPGLVDRMLAAAAAAGLEGVVVLNKTDLCAPDEAEEFAAPFRHIGYPVLLVSAKENLGLESLREAMRGRLSLLLGHSGVGKSSLLNALDPSLQLRTGALNRQDKGRHTTTYSSLLLLDFGGQVVDSPGIREFGLAGMKPAELGHHFVELRSLLDDCRYPDCTHDHEPDCAVRAAVERGEVHKRRYASYRKLLEELKGGGERMPRHGSF